MSLKYSYHIIYFFACFSVKNRKNLKMCTIQLVEKLYLRIVVFLALCQITVTLGLNIWLPNSLHEGIDLFIIMSLFDFAFVSVYTEVNLPYLKYSVLKLVAYIMFFVFHLIPKDTFTMDPEAYAAIIHIITKPSDWFQC